MIRDFLHKVLWLIILISPKKAIHFLCLLPNKQHLIKEIHVKRFYMYLIILSTGLEQGNPLKFPINITNN